MLQPRKKELVRVLLDSFGTADSEEREWALEVLQRLDPESASSAGMK
jgi:hypothetical protein